MSIFDQIKMLVGKFVLINPRLTEGSFVQDVFPPKRYHLNQTNK